MQKRNCVRRCKVLRSSLRLTIEHMNNIAFWVIAGLMGSGAYPFYKNEPDAPLMKSGLLGPVRLLSSESVSIDL